MAIWKVGDVLDSQLRAVESCLHLVVLCAYVCYRSILRSGSRSRIKASPLDI